MPFSGERWQISIIYRMNAPAKIEIFDSATAFEKGKFRKIRFTGTVIPPPPMPPDMASAKAMKSTN